MTISFMNQTVTVIRPALVDRRGSQSLDYAGGGRHELARCLVTASATSRDFGGRVVQVTDRKTLRAPYDADILAGDRIVVDGIVYDIDGEVVKTTSPTGRVSSTRCELVRWEG